jgi:hypothetical protein
MSRADNALKRNIVFILADRMSRDGWGIYGIVDCRTPDIERSASADPPGCFPPLPAGSMAACRKN